MYINTPVWLLGDAAFVCLLGVWSQEAMCLMVLFVVPA